jgi:hypothetical protein
MNYERIKDEHMDVPRISEKMNEEDSQYDLAKG